MQRADRLAVIGGIRAPAPADAPHVHMPPPPQEATNAERRKAAKRL